MMNYCKDFLYRIRKLAYSADAHIYLRRVSPRLIQIVCLLADVKFENGSYHTYYGDVKNVLSGFLTFYYVAIDDIIKDADRLNNLATREDLVELIEKTIEIHHANLDDFRNYYDSPLDDTEKQKVQEIEDLFIVFMNKVNVLQDTIEKIHKPEDAREFANSHCLKSVEAARTLCEFTHSYLSSMLADDLDKTRVSLLDIKGRLKNNLRDLNEDSKKEFHSLRNELYDLNKKQKAYKNVIINRSSIDIAETEAETENVKIRVTNFKPKVSLTPLEEELAFWDTRIADYNKVANNLIALKKEMNRVEKQKAINETRVNELPGSNRTCWEKTYAKHKAYLKDLWDREARALCTFYVCRGLDRIFYTDNLGKYYLDEFNHQVYFIDHGMTDYHVTCRNEFKTPPDKQYYYDKNGRYVYQRGKKMYQLAPCASLYTLGPDDLLDKPPNAKKAGMTEEEFLELQCRRKIKDANDVTILPDNDPIDITNTMKKDNANYLWDTFGGILSHALRDVATAKSKNPIHYLAHRLLYHKYNTSEKEFREMQTEAEAFKANINKTREEKLLSGSKAWKSKQQRRRKPEESDEIAERAAFDAHIAQKQFINALNNVLQ